MAPVRPVHRFKNFLSGMNQSKTKWKPTTVPFEDIKNTSPIHGLLKTASDLKAEMSYSAPGAYIQIGNRKFCFSKLNIDGVKKEVTFIWVPVSPPAAKQTGKQVSAKKRGVKKTTAKKRTATSSATVAQNPAQNVDTSIVEGVLAPGFAQYMRENARLDPNATTTGLDQVISNFIRDHLKLPSPYL